MHHASVGEVVGASCATGYRGRFCSRCELQWYRANDTQCKECSDFTWLLYTVAGLAVALAIPVLVKLARMHSFASFNILLGYLQVSPTTALSGNLHDTVQHSTTICLSLISFHWTMLSVIISL